MESSSDMQSILSTEKRWAPTTAYPRLKKTFPFIKIDESLLLYK